MRLDEVLEQHQQGAQAADADAHLVDALHLLAAQGRGLVGQQIVEHAGRQAGERLVRGHAGFERDRMGLARLGLAAVAQAPAALGLALVEQGERRHLQQVETQAKERILGAALEFQLELAQRLAGIARSHAAVVERQLDLRACGGRHAEAGAPHVGAEDRFERLALEPGRTGNLGQPAAVGLGRSDRPFAFLAVQHAVARRLHGLHEAIIGLADAQREACLAQRPARRVEVGRVLGLRRAAIRRGQGLGMTLDPLARLGRKGEFQLGFHGVLPVVLGQRGTRAEVRNEGR
jgi:hypothetical protein